MVAPVSDIKKLIVDLRNSSLMVCSFEYNYDIKQYVHNRKIPEWSDTSNLSFFDVLYFPIPYRINQYWFWVVQKSDFTYHMVFNIEQSYIENILYECGY